MLPSHFKILMTGVTSIHGWPVFSALREISRPGQLLAVRPPKMNIPAGDDVRSVCITDKKTFTDETPFRVYNFRKTSIIDGKITVTIPDLTTGTYGITLIDDKNENGKIDYHFFIPSKGFGFSNYYFKGTCKPPFEAFAFQLSDENNTIKIQVQYF